MSTPALRLEPYQAALQGAPLLRRWGRVTQVVGMAVEATGIEAALEEVCLLRQEDGSMLPMEVVGFRGGRAILLPYGELRGVGPRSLVRPTGAPLQVPVGPALLGRVLDAFGRPMDGLGPLGRLPRRPAAGQAPPPLSRPRITRPLVTGVRAIDGLLTCGRGQRMGIFSGAGVGKSTLLGMITRGTNAHVSVIALIGERGREVREFLERDLGSGIQRSVVVVSTADQPPAVRLAAARVAMSIAEDFRDRGLDVLLLVDSLSRIATAQREVGLAAGEPPSARGYPPSVFALLPRLLERAGTAERGTITGFYTVLVDGDDPTEPVADAVRSFLDGHLLLSRDLAQAGHFPAVNVLASLSRVMPDLVDPAHYELACRLRRLLAAYEEARDLVEVGAYAHGSNPEVDRAIALRPAILAFLRQERTQLCTLEETLAHLRHTLGEEAS